MVSAVSCCAAKLSISFVVVPVMPCHAAMFSTCERCVATYGFLALASSLKGPGVEPQQRHVIMYICFVSGGFTKTC